MKKKHIPMWIAALVFLVMLSGCSAEPSDAEEASTLWVLTELSNSDGMNLQAEIIAERMEADNPGLTVILDILPIDEEERELRMTQLRTQIMSGNGPDVYLMPTGSELIADEPITNENIPITPLFTNIEQAKRNGVFLDVSEFYEADTELNTAALKQEIMEAGCLGDKRYILPLRFQLPVIYTRPDLYAEYGLSPELFESDFLTVAQTVLSRENAETGAIGLKFPENLEAMGTLVNYENGEVLLTVQQIADYMQLHQKRNIVAAESAQAVYDACDYARIELFFSDGHQECTIENWDSGIGPYAWPQRGEFHHECFNLLAQYTNDLYHWTTIDIPLYTGYLSNILDTIGVTRLTGQEVEVYPLRTLDGSVQASVTYWGAVGSSCRDPELSYEFLRQFLMEEFQWDIYRPRVDRSLPYWMQPADPQFDGQVEDSFPVRTEGCVEPLWNNMQYQIKGTYTTWVNITVQNSRAIQQIFVTEEDVPAMDWEIDKVYFPIAQVYEESLEYGMSLLNEEDGTPTDVDIDELAEEIRQNLWWHLAEG